jgi:hypothetical protein
LNRSRRETKREIEMGMEAEYRQMLVIALSHSLEIALSGYLLAFGHSREWRSAGRRTRRAAASTSRTVGRTNRDEGSLVRGQP